MPIVTWVTCLDLAEKARRDPSLRSDHRGTVDRLLTNRLAEDKQLLAAISDDADEADLVHKLEGEIAAIEHALTAYSEPPEAVSC